ncbi:MBL fold metallo-hydrolase [Candidatus Poribacteria bacterium]|nr:MBL fold metallo-hydrolase [Candidatus Poribacteria bacterium]
MILEDEFGDIIQKARSGRGLSIAQVARETQISQEQLSKMENYTLKPTAEQVDKIAAVLGLSAPKLLDIAMKRWTPEKWDVNFDNAITVVPLSVTLGSGYSAYCYLLTCNQMKATAIVDTGGNPDQVITAVNENNLKPSLILITHEHSDHAGGLRKLQVVTQAHVIASKAAALPSEVRECTKLEDGAEIELGSRRIKILHTPGHTQGSCCYYVSKATFVGDTIFAGSVGRGGFSYSSLLESIRNKIFTLDDDVHLFPGHGPITTVGQEKAHNPFF